jgi:lipoprotein-anchoring transpeptidase ErfK/SrfK
VLEDFKTKESIAEVGYFVKANNHGSNGDDYGDTYVEVSLSEQHLWYYKNGALTLDSPIVTGIPNSERETPNGMYTILYKQRDATLVGEDYEAPVAYWMPFDTDVGFHDATWQTSFGGDRYLTYGSHGCVNMPLSAAEALYSYVQEGDTVVVY